MKGITRVSCLLLLLGIVGAIKPSPPEAALEQILHQMDDSVNPCEDFQKFSSGKFLDNHKEDEIYNFYGLVKHKFNERMQKVFDRLKYRVLRDSNSVEEKVWLFYNTCLTAPRITHAWKHYIGLVSPGRDLTWPHLTPRDSQWSEENFKWLETLARLRRFGLNSLLIEMKVQPSRKYSSKFEVFIGKQRINRIEKEGQTKDLLISLGVSRKRARILARDITALESEIKELAELEGSPTELSIEEFEKRTKLALGKYLGTAFGSSFEPSLMVQTSELPYLEGLQNLLDTFESETVASYLMISFVRYLRGLVGSAAEGDPGKCAAAVAFHMDTASELLYKDFYFRFGKFQRYNNDVQQLFDLISKSFLGQLQSNRLNLTALEVQFFTQKLKSMTVIVGKLPNVVNQRSFVGDFYWNLNLESSEPDFAVMHLKVLWHRNRKVLEQLDGSVPTGKEFFLLSNNDYISAEPELLVFRNTVVLPINILQEPFYTTEMHNVFKMSLLGFILTRQILQNFVPHNLTVDGNEHNQAYLDAIACLNNRNSKLMEDRVLDVMALKTVYRMYFEDDSHYSQKQPSFTNFPLRQLFLLNFAWFFSGEAEHGDTNELRLSQALRNLQSFGKDFNCPTSEALNSCEMW
ncbi:hypothetical protein KR200_008688 [Drosophila serrata]|nr:hypothetical protein KR200_008688 [Drosophila serrata]